MAGKGEKPIDLRAVNPRYRGAMMSDVVRALLRPKSQKVREALDRLQGRPEGADDDGPESGE